MLVLTRKYSEQILIGDDIVITVVRIEGDRVRLGVDAPENVSIDRQEIRDLEEYNRERYLLKHRSGSRKFTCSRKR